MQGFTYLLHDLSCVVPRVRGLHTESFENNNWVNLDSWGNSYEIYGNRTVMTALLNLNHFLIIKGIFLKASFMFVTIFWDIYENLRRKNFINPSCPEHPKIIEIKIDIHFFLTSLWCFKKVFIKP